MIRPDSLQEDIGRETLDIFSNADHFNHWLYSRLRMRLADGILEIGSGIGNISYYLLEEFSCVTLSDVDPGYRDLLRKKFRNSKQMVEVLDIDLGDPNLLVNQPGLKGAFNTVVASNVVEHIEHDDVAVKNAFEMLKKGGKFVVLVPAYNWLFNSFDRGLGHWRRYNKKSLNRLLVEGGFDIVSSSYFNAFGLLGWWLSGTILRRKVLPGNQVALFNKLVPLIRIFDTLSMRKIGLSVVSVGQKRD